MTLSRGVDLREWRSTWFVSDSSTLLGTEYLYCTYVYLYVLLYTAVHGRSLVHSSRRSGSTAVGGDHLCSLYDSSTGTIVFMGACVPDITPFNSSSRVTSYYVLVDYSVLLSRSCRIPCLLLGSPNYAKLLCC